MGIATGFGHAWTHWATWEVEGFWINIPLSPNPILPQGCDALPNPNQYRWCQPIGITAEIGDPDHRPICGMEHMQK